jgi:hypothetical protein
MRWSAWPSTSSRRTTSWCSRSRCGSSNGGSGPFRHCDEIRRRLRSVPAAADAVGCLLGQPNGRMAPRDGRVAPRASMPSRATRAVGTPWAGPLGAAGGPPPGRARGTVAGALHPSSTPGGESPTSGACRPAHPVGHGLAVGRHRSGASGVDRCRPHRSERASAPRRAPSPAAPAGRADRGGAAEAGVTARCGSPPGASLRFCFGSGKLQRRTRRGGPVVHVWPGPTHRCPSRTASGPVPPPPRRGSGRALADWPLDRPAPFNGIPDGFP